MSRRIGKESLSILVERLRVYNRELSKLEEEFKVGRPSMFDQKRLSLMESKIQHYQKQLWDFGSGEPIFKIKSLTKEGQVIEYFQCDNKDEAMAAFTLLRPDHIFISIKEISLRKETPVKNNN